jgi:hypothetical protein
LPKNFDVSISMPTPFLSDSTEVIIIACDPIKHELAKHIDIDVYYTQS